MTRARFLLILLTVLLCGVGAYLLFGTGPANEPRDRAPPRAEGASEPEPPPPGISPEEEGAASEPAAAGEDPDSGTPGGSDPEKEGSEEGGEEEEFSYLDETPYSVRVRVFDLEQAVIQAGGHQRDDAVTAHRAVALVVQEQYANVAVVRGRR